MPTPTYPQKATPIAFAVTNLDTAGKTLAQLFNTTAAEYNLRKAIIQIDSTSPVTIDVYVSGVLFTTLDTGFVPAYTFEPPPDYCFDGNLVTCKATSGSTGKLKGLGYV